MREVPTLEGDYVTLKPMSRDDIPALWQAGKDPSIWAYMPMKVDSEKKMSIWVDSLLNNPAQTMAWCTMRAGQVVGSTCLLAMDEYNKRVEIGGTWIHPDHQRSAVNTEAKLLQLTYCFEDLQLNRVELKTDALNERSRNAILRLGAQQEGIFRHHMVMPGGRLRDSVYFSIIRDEWPAIRTKLTERLQQSPN